MNRFHEFERLAHKARQQLPAVHQEWLAPIRGRIEHVLAAAISHDVTDAQFTRIAQKFARDLPKMLHQMDVQALADALHQASATAFVAGLQSRTHHPQAHFAARLSLYNLTPWWQDPPLRLLHGGKGQGKRCGNTWISHDKQCHITSTPANHWKPDPKQGKISLREALQILRKGKTLHNPYGEKVTLNRSLLKHWREGKKTLWDKKNRIKR